MVRKRPPRRLHRLIDETVDAKLVTLCHVAVFLDEVNTTTGNGQTSKPF
jgi:hypothetical protein